MTERDQTVAELRARLEEAEETLRAIRAGEVDALVVQGPDGEHIYTLQGADEPYRVLVEEMHEGAVTVGADGIVLFCNRRFAELTGCPSSTVVGGQLKRFVPDEEHDALAGVLRRTGQHRGRLRRADGTTRDAYFAVVALTPGDTAHRAVVISDLTDILDARHRQEAAERDSRAKDEFLAMLGHELRNPLAAIASAAAVLDAIQGENAATVRPRAVISRQVQRLARLVDDLLDVGRVISGNIHLDRQPVDLAAIVHSTVASLHLFPGSREPVQVDAMPVWVLADTMRMEQVIGNLIGNALKFTPGTGTVTVCLRKVDETAVLTVEDTGEGIRPDLLPRVFDLFVQGDTALDRKRSGLGIGLTLVRRIVEDHGGSVTAESDGVGCGARFTVRLPAVAPPSAAELAPSRGTQAPRRVLVVDDDDDGRKMLMAMLETAGHVVVGAADGWTAVARIDEQRFDIAFVDIGLPGLDGYEVAHRIRSTPHAAGLRLIALSGYGTREHRDRASASGFDGYLTKPAPPDEIARQIEMSGSSETAR